LIDGRNEPATVTRMDASKSAKPKLHYLEIGRSDSVQTGGSVEAREKLSEAKKVRDLKPAAEADLPRPKPVAGAPIPQPEIQTCDNPFSTFSLNVSDVSFKLAAASLEKGVMPDPAGIRSEEFINAFDYRDPEPSAGVPIAFAWDRARYPFAQNRDLLRF